MAENIKTVKIKVKPYPIAVTLERNGAIFPCNILMLSLKGFIVDTKTHVFVVGEEVLGKATLPVGHGEIISQCRVIKTYDQLLKGPPKTTQRMAEFHFVRPSQDLLEMIHTFLKDIRQIPR